MRQGVFPRGVGAVLVLLLWSCSAEGTSDGATASPAAAAGSGAGAAGSAFGAVSPTSGQVETARFHHVHLNVTDAARTVAFYEKFFGALPVLYRDRSPALFTERSFILLDEVGEPPGTNLGTTIWHIGWAGVDGPTEFDWRRREGIEVQTPITPLGSNFYMYFWGPDREVIEVYTGSRNHRFEHVHLIASDVHGTITWFEEHLGLGSSRPVEPGARGSTIRVDNVNLIVWVNPMGGANPHPADVPPEIGAALGTTDGRAIDHIAFSYPDIRPVAARMAAAGVEIVRGIQTNEVHGLTSFLVRAPDGLLVEIVEEAPIPEGIWR